MAISTYGNETVGPNVLVTINGTKSALWTNLDVTRIRTIGLTTAYVVLFLVAVPGNAFVIHVARKLLPTRGAFNLLVINMAACDILYAITIVILQLRYLYIGGLWLPGNFGAFLCKFSYFSLLFAVYSSIFTLTAMTVERYLAIVPRDKRPVTRRNVLKIIIAVHGFSCLPSITELFKMDIGHFHDQNTTVTYCYGKWSDNNDRAYILLKVEVITKFIIMYVLPVIIMVTLYYSIIRFLWLRTIPGNRTQQNELQKRKHLKKVIFMLVAMAITFAITWLAAHVVHYYYAFDNDSSLSTFLQTLLFWVAHTNCATNPCFYLVFNKEYRDELRRLGERLTSCFKWRTVNAIDPKEQCVNNPRSRSEHDTENHLHLSRMDCSVYIRK